ncbi:unnamed protein product [Paramecium pentaurelia]|uniref:Uncharacterized protein n=1 Tax=Paramecium pentaurelia TaxID=43138 RepID=A0A8S1TTP3_9CILI|nr:unnamed protein product [Paramecium pentaurelia]
MNSWEKFIFHRVIDTLSLLQKLIGLITIFTQEFMYCFLGEGTKVKDLDSIYNTFYFNKQRNKKVINRFPY